MISRRADAPPTTETAVRTRETARFPGGVVYSKALGREVRYRTDDELAILEQSNELQEIVEANDTRLNRKKWYQIR